MARKQYISSALRSSALGGIAAIAKNRLRHFAADQSGNMSYVAIAGSLVMLVFGGIGVDMMHAELKRNKVQNTLDRAVLAAANIDNEMDPTFVVNDYFRAMNMADTLSSVEVQQGINSKRVTASGETTIPSNFMSLIGVDTLAAAGRARAENAGALMEISLVLDISGSMSGQKIEQLKTAAKSFVDMVLGEGGAESNVTISIVPYNATVNLGDSFSQYFRLEGLHDYSHCAWFNAADFDTTEIDPNATLGQISHFDLYGNGQGAPELSSPWCYTGETAAIVPHSSDPDVLKARIDAFQAQGNTAIDLGMKWGLALLDPTMRPVMEDMNRDGLVPDVAAIRPAAYEDNQTMKFVIVMTDGENTQQYDLKGHNKSGMSDVWIDDRGTPDTGDDRYSIRLNSSTFFWPHLSSYQNPYRSGPYSHVTGGAVSVLGDVVTDPRLATALGRTLASLAPPTPGNASWDDGICGDDADDYNGGVCREPIPRRLSNAELNGRIKTTARANNWYWRMYQDRRISYSTYQNAYYAWETKVNASQADDRLSTVCGAARSNGVVIYSIGVEAPSRGLQAMRDCASSPSHYFDVSGDELEETFNSIATILTQLRLTL